jgi:hypothetical protein
MGTKLKRSSWGKGLKAPLALFVLPCIPLNTPFEFFSPSTTRDQLGLAHAVDEEKYLKGAINGA